MQKLDRSIRDSDWGVHKRYFNGLSHLVRSG